MQFFKFLKRSLRLGTWPLIQRYIVAKKIKKFPPNRISPSNIFSVHTLLNRKDILMYEWMLHSLLHFAKVDFSVHIHDDGSFTDKDAEYMKYHFPGIIIWRKFESDKLVLDKLKPFPNLLRYRKSEFWALKALDVYFLSDSKYMVLIDADVLFFDMPAELFLDDNKNMWMEDVCYMLGIESAKCEEHLGIKKLLPINAGLGKVLRKGIDLDLAENLLGIQQNPVNDMIFHALFSTGNGGIELLDNNYELSFKMGVQGKKAKHFTNPIRFWFWEEGVPYLVNNFGIKQHRFLNERL